MGLSEEEAQERMLAIDAQLLQLAATLAGLCPAAALDQTSPVWMLVDTRAVGGSLCPGELLLAPAFISADGEARVEAALEAMIHPTNSSTL